MLCMFTADILDTKVIDNEGEKDRAGDMFE